MLCCDTDGTLPDGSLLDDQLPVPPCSHTLTCWLPLATLLAAQHNAPMPRPLHHLKLSYGRHGSGAVLRLRSHPPSQAAGTAANV